MNLRAGSELLVVLVALVLGVLFVRQRDGRLRAEGRLEVLQIEADSARAQAARAVAAERFRTREAERRLVEESVVRERAQQDAAAARAQQASRVDTIIRVAVRGDTTALRAALDTFVATVDAERQALLGVIRSDSIVIVELENLAASRLDAMNALEARALGAEAVAEAAIDSRPGFFSRTGGKLLWFGVGYITNELVTD